MKIITSFFKPNKGEWLFWVDKSFMFCLSPFESMKYSMAGRITLLEHWTAIDLLHLKSVPPGWGLTFSSYPLRLAKIAFTPEDFRKIWVYPWRIGSYPWRIWVYPWRILWKLRLHPQRIPYFVYSISTPKEILNFYNLPLDNSMVPQPGRCGY